jgi:uncharacterized protein (TIGR03089 family)
MLVADPARPRITWYGPDGERIELSGRALDNWVAKTANLLVDELDAGPGSRVLIALPAHWRAASWLLATWSTGACAVVLPTGSTGSDTPLPPADVLVAADPALLARAGAAYQRVAVALPAMAMRVEVELPLGVLDGATEVRAHGDVFVTLVPPLPEDPAFEVGAVALTHAELLAAAGRAADDAGMPPGVRLLVGAGPQGAVGELLAPLLRGGSLVLHHDLAGLDAAARSKIATQERVTHLSP